MILLNTVFISFKNKISSICTRSLSFIVEVETSFMPWLMEKTMAQVNQLVLGRTILDSMIRDVVHQRVDDYQKLEETLRQVKFKFEFI